MRGLVLLLLPLLVAASNISKNSSSSSSGRSSSRSSCSLIDPGAALNATVFLTIQARDDGLGAIIARIVPAVAFSQRLGWQFAGVFGRDKSSGHVSHFVEEIQFLNFYFGNGSLLFEHNYLEAAMHTTHWPYTKMVIRPQDFDFIEQRVDKHISSGGAQLILQFSGDDFFHPTNVPASDDPTNSTMRHVAFNRSVKAYIDEPFLVRLRRGAVCGVTHVLQEYGNFFSSSPPWVNTNEVKPSKLQAARGKVTVAVHMRLGDVVRGSIYPANAMRFTPLSWYYHVLLGLEQLLPNADIHVFTSFDVHHPEVTRVAMRALGTLRLMGYRVHASNESSAHNGEATREAMRDMAHMASADVLLTARSSFSIVAGYLNPNCVLYLPFRHAPLEGWISLPAAVYDHPGAMRIIAEHLPPCLQKKGVLLS